MDDARPETQGMAKHASTNCAIFAGICSLLACATCGCSKYMKYNVGEYGGNAGFYCCNFSWFPQNEANERAVGAESGQIVPSTWH